MQKSNWSFVINRVAAICSFWANDVTIPNEWRYCLFKNEDTASTVGKLPQKEMLRQYLLEKHNGTIKCTSKKLLTQLNFFVIQVFIRVKIFV